MTHDLLVIGGGSAGYAAARTARDHGAQVGIVDPGPLGGLCILRGCMPSKAILRSSDIIALMRRAKEFGLAAVDAQADLNAILDRKTKLVAEFAEDRIKNLKDTRFTLYEEPAMFLSPHEVKVGHKVLTAKAFLIATGSVPTRVAIPGLEEVGYLTSDDVLDLRKKPESLLVLGGGAVALELGQFYARIGTQVTMIQRSPHLLSHTDDDLVRPVERRFRQEGMTIFCGTKLDRFTQTGALKTAHFTHGGKEKHVSAVEVFQALGRRPNSDGLNLEAAQVKTEQGRVVVGTDMRTSQPHIFAAGDVTGLHEIVHIAIQQGEIAAVNSMYPTEVQQHMEDRLLTEVVFSDPPVASVGLTEKACAKKGIAYLSASYPFNDHGKSLVMGELHGHVKLLCDPHRGELLGAHIVGPEAGELIHELIAVMYFHGTVEDLVKIPHYHPTLAEIVTYPAEELLTRLEPAT